MTSHIFEQTRKVVLAKAPDYHITTTTDFNRLPAARANQFPTVSLSRHFCRLRFSHLFPLDVIIKCRGCRSE
jgi:hypothetical protein